MTAKLAAIINMKGGVGKTTLSYNLAAELGGSNRVLLIDLDPQANATVLCADDATRVAHAKSKKTITDLFIDTYSARGPIEVKPLDRPVLGDFILPVAGGAGSGGFDLIPADIYLSSVLRGMSIGPFSLDWLIDEQARNAYQYILVDCAPTYSALTTVALNTCRAVLIPMIADSFGYFGTELMKQIIAEHRHDYGIDVRVIGVVFMLRDTTATGATYETRIITEWGPQVVFRSRITENKWYRVANGQRIPFSDSRASGHAKAELATFVAEFVSKA